MMAVIEVYFEKEVSNPEAENSPTTHLLTYTSTTCCFMKMDKFLFICQLRNENKSGTSLLLQLLVRSLKGANSSSSLVLFSVTVPEATARRDIPQGFVLSVSKAVMVHQLPFTTDTFIPSHLCISSILLL